MTRQAFTPREYQRTMIDFIIDNPRCAVFAGMGMGKTCGTLTALDILELTEPGPTLVLAPLRVAESTWPDEARKWSHLKDCAVSAVVGSPDERRAALRRPATIYTTNYENLPWLVEHFGGAWPFRKIVCDESTKLKGFRGSVQTSSKGKEFLRLSTGVRAKALAQIAHCKVDRVIELTGTPSPNGLKDLWGQAWFLDAGQRLGRTFEGFKGRWFQSIQKGADRNSIELVPLPFAQEQIQDRLRDLCLSLDAKDYFDLADPIVTTVRVEMPAKAKQLYRDMEKEMFMSVSGHEIEAFNAASKTIKCLQLANGAAYTDPATSDDEHVKAGQFIEIHDAKIQALESIVAEAAGMPVLVAYHFKSDLARLLKAFPKGRALDKSPQTIRDWNAGKIPILFAHPASAGHGLNLQDGGNILAIFGHWWDLEQYLQILERIGPVRQLQAGHNRPVFIYHIVAAGTVDELVMARRDSKRTVQDILLEAMKRRTAPCS